MSCAVDASEASVAAAGVTALNSIRYVISTDSVARSSTINAIEIFGGTTCGTLDIIQFIVIGKYPFPDTAVTF